MGGAHLYQSPPPDPQQIASAFLRTILRRATTFGLALSSEQVAEVASWLGVNTDGLAPDSGSGESEIVAP